MANCTYTEVIIEGDCKTVVKMADTLRMTEKYPRTNPGFLSVYAPVNIGVNNIDAWDTRRDIYEVTTSELIILTDHAGFSPSAIFKCTWETDWSPCIGALKSISSNFDVVFRTKYIDEGRDYVGTTTIIGGQINYEMVYRGDDFDAGVYHIFGHDYWFEHVFEQAVLYDFDEDIQDYIEADYINEDMKARCLAFLQTSAATVKK